LQYIEVIVLCDKYHPNYIDDLVAALKQRLPSSIKFEILVNKPLLKVNEGKLNPFISLIKS
jgi:hypothetical protein